MKMSELFTRDTANRGVRIPLVDSRTGKETEQWLLVLGTDSDSYRAQQRENQRRLIEIVKASRGPDQKSSEAAFEKALEAETPRMHRLALASLVGGWSLEDGCTKANVLQLLEQAPGIEDTLERYEKDQSLFFAAASTGSTASPSINSDSTEPQKDNTNPSEQALPKSGKPPARSRRTCPNIPNRRPNSNTSGSGTAT